MTQTKQVEDHGAQEFVERVDAGAGTQFREGSIVGSAIAIPWLLKLLFLDLYKFFGKRTDVWLAEMTFHKDKEVLRNNTSPTHVVMNIVSREAK